MRREFCALKVCGRELNEFMAKCPSGDLSCELGILFKFPVIIETLTVIGLNMLKRCKINPSCKNTDMTFTMVIGKTMSITRNFNEIFNIDVCYAIL